MNISFGKAFILSTKELDRIQPDGNDIGDFTRMGQNFCCVNLTDDIFGAEHKALLLTNDKTEDTFDMYKNKTVETFDMVKKGELALKDAQKQMIEFIAKLAKSAPVIDLDKRTDINLDVPVLDLKA